MFPIVFVATLATTLTIWTNHSAAGITSPMLSLQLIAWGNLAGLLAYNLCLWQLLLIGRIGWIERPWGHDKLSHLHHVLGITAIAILILHPVLMTLGYSKEAGMLLASQFWLFLTSFDHVLQAFIAYLMFVSIVALSLWIVRKRLRYEVWYGIHVLLYLAIILAFNHQFELGRDFSAVWAYRFWQAFFYGTLLTVLYYRFLKPAWQFHRYQFRVAHIERETADVTSAIIEGKDMERLRAGAGQFVIVHFLGKGFWWEAHPFSLSEMPNGKRLRLTVKAVGDFTRRIPEIPVGTRVWLEGPLGRFTADRASREKILLIAGGIGITPLRALFEKFARLGRKVDLIYAARTEKDFALKSELENIKNENASISYVPGDTVGKLTPEIMQTQVPDILERYVYVCGPPPMIQMVREQLIQMGLAKEFIRYEKFQLG